MERATRLATGPVTWGVDFADAPGNPPWERVLDEIAASSLSALELGPVGYLPEDPARLRDALDSRGLEAVGSFVFEDLHDPRRRDAVLADTRRACAAIAAAGGSVLVTIDRPGAERAATAGRSAHARRLGPDEWRGLVGTAREIAAVATGHGLRPVFHPHAGGYVEFADEVERLLADTDFDLCLDTGHCAYAGIDPERALLHFGDRIGHVHLKDVRGAVLDRVRAERLDFWTAIADGVFCPLGEGVVRIPAVLGALHRIGYAGHATIEQDRVPGSGAPLEDLERSVAVVADALTAVSCAPGSLATPCLLPRTRRVRDTGRMSTIDYAVVDPATGETIKTYDTISDADLEAATGRAAEAHREWGRGTTVQERAKIIARVAELHEERKQELAEIIVREMGKPIEQAVGEAEFAGAIYQYYADNGAKLLEDEPIELLEGEGSAFIRRSSVGLLLGIMPWNYPYYQVARFAGPNLVVGNTILLKHAPQCPESSAAMEQIFHEAGVPKDAYINIYATNDQIASVIADPRVQGVSLTGSGRAGAAVAELAGRHLKKVVLELGGSDPFLVLRADDMDAVVEAAVGGRLENTGQACNAAKRFIVLDDYYDAFVDKFSAALTGVEPGDPKSADTTIGPLSSTNAADRLEHQVQEALDKGARLAAGGGREGNFFKTAVLTDITPDNPAYKEEFFGPVAQVYKVGSEDEAIRLANDTPYGLGSYVFTSDQEQALRVADQIEAGMVFINAVGAEGVELPFGGVKASGFGRELGRFGADEFVNKKLIRVGG